MLPLRAVLTSFATLLAFACGGSRAAEPGQPQSPPPPPVTRGSASAAPAALADAPGDVCAFHSSALPPPITATPRSTAAAAPASPPPAAPTHAPAPDPAAERSFGEAAITQADNASQLLIRREMKSVGKGAVGCFEQLASRKGVSSGRVVVGFDIVPRKGQGALENVRVEKAPASDAELEQCIARLLQARTFPAPKGGGRVHVSYPFDFVIDQPAPAGPADAAGWLASYPSQTGLILYEHKAARLQAFLVTASGLAAQGAIDVDAKTLAAAVDELRGSLGVHSEAGRGLVLSADRGASATRTRADAALRRITEIAFPGDVARALAGLEHLVLVPTLDLGTVPFPMLAPFADGSLVVDHMSVTVAPSLDDLRRPPPAWALTPQSSLVVGDPLLGQGLALSPLPGARREATMVASRFGATALIGADATESAVASRAGSADILYFASHGLADEVNPLDGLLALAGDSAADGKWTAREIQRARFDRAQLAVLSACQTGRGAAHAGGTIGLARAFHLAGVRRVMMSLWDVDDEGTYELMCRMVGHLGEDFPAEALRKAMLEQRAAGAPAAVWAAFSVFGVPG